MKPLSPKEQYRMAYRLLRLQVATEVNTSAQDRIYRSFGITSPAIIDHALTAKLQSGTKVIGWTSWHRYYDFCEALDKTKEL